jgi:magnesium chelatase family protein
MFSRVLSGGLQGVDAYQIEVEVDCSSGIGQIQIVGLPDTAVKESQERVRAAIKALCHQGKSGWLI